MIFESVIPMGLLSNNALFPAINRWAVIGSSRTGLLTLARQFIGGSEMQESKSPIGTIEKYGL